MRLEEAERKIRAAEAKIAEKDQRITEVERLLGCMGKVKHVSICACISTLTRDFPVTMMLSYLIELKSILFFTGKD